MTKNNIMKHTDGLFAQVFHEVAKEYPDLESDHQIIDIGAARLAATPERFDVIVTLNLYGDILSDIAAQIAGSVGLAGSANVGENLAMYEAVHGSAPDIAGKGVANPSGLLLAATQMLVQLGKAEVAERIKNAWLVTLESGIHPADVYRPQLSVEQAGTARFTQAVIERLGETPKSLEPVRYRSGGIQVAAHRRPRPTKELVGVDVFLDWDEGDRNPEVLGRDLEKACPPEWRLKMVTNRGVKVYPGGAPETFATDHWRCRFLPTRTERTLEFGDVLSLLTGLHVNRFDVIKTEHLYTFDGERAYSLGQGE